MPPNFENSIVVSEEIEETDDEDFSAGPDFTRTTEIEDTVAEQISAYGKGANTFLLRDLIGGTIDLAAMLPTLLQDIDPFALAEKAVRGVIRGHQWHAGVEEEDLIAPFKKDYQTRPFTPVAPVLGDILQKTKLGYEDISQVRPSLRPFAVAGETTAAGASLAAPLFNLARYRKIAESAPRVLDPLLRFIQKRPGEAAGVEAAATLLSGAGGGAAERVWPGDPSARFLGEIIAPSLPASVAARYGPRMARGAADRVASYVSPRARQRRAAEKLQSLMQDVEGPEAAHIAATSIEQARSRGVAGTPAQLTASPTLTAIERELVKVSNKLGGQVKAETAKAIEQSNRAWDALQPTGDIESLQKAAEALSKTHIAWLDQRLAQVLKLQQEAAEKVAISGARGLPDISAQAKQLLDNTRQVAKDHAKKLYADIPDNQIVTPKNLADKMNEVTEAFVKGENFPSSLSGPLSRAKRTNKAGDLVTTFTSKQLKRMRTTLLAEARQLRRRPRGEGDTDAYLLEEVAAGIYEDLAFGPEGILANTFYKKYANRFKRGPAGDLFHRFSQGELLPDEVALDQALSGAAQKYGIGFKRLREAEAISLPDDMRRSAGLTLKTPSDLSRLQSEFLMRMAAETIDFNGAVKLGSLQSFIRKHERAIKDLGITELYNLESAAITAERMSSTIARRKQYSSNRSVTSKIISDAGAQIRSALDSTGEISNQRFRNLSRIATRNPNTADKAMDGLRTTLLEELLARAGTENGVMSGRKLSELLDAPMRSAKRGVVNPSLREILKTNGILTPRHDKGLNALIERVTKLEDAMGNPAAFDDLLGETGDFPDLVYRVFGTQMAQRSPITQNMGSQLVMAEAGSRMARKWLGRMPLLNIRATMIEAVNNPDLMATLLREPVSLPAKRAKENALNAYLIQAGTRLAVTDEETE